MPAKQTLFLYFSVCIANLMTFSAIVCFTWSATSIPRLNGNKEPENNPLDSPITLQQESLIASLYFIGATLGPVAAGLVARRIGRRLTIICFTIPTVISLLIKAFTHSIELVFLARFLGGLTGGTVLTSIPLFVAEISEVHNRGILGALSGLFSTLGGLYTYSVGSYVSIKAFSLSALVAPIVLIVVMILYIPETPYFWISRGNEKQAIKSLRKLRSGSEKIILEEIDVIKRAIEESVRYEASFADIWKSRALRRSLLITIVGNGIQQFYGVFAIQLYLQDIFVAAGSDLTPEMSSIILGIVKVGGYVMAVLAVDRFGRRFLLLESSIGSCLCLISIGVYFYLKTEGYNVGSINWLPLVSLIFFDLFYNSGIGCVPLIQIGELFPERLKSIASIAVMTICALLSFLVTLLFPYMVEAMGMGPPFWVFAASGLISAVFTYFVVPETKGKSLYEIQVMISK